VCVVDGAPVIKSQQLFSFKPISPTDVLPARSTRLPRELGGRVELTTSAPARTEQGQFVIAVMLTSRRAVDQRTNYKSHSCLSGRSIWIAWLAGGIVSHHECDDNGPLRASSVIGADGVTSPRPGAVARFGRQRSTRVIGPAKVSRSTAR